MNVLALIEQPGNVCCRYRIDAYAPELTKRGHRLQAISLREGGRLRFLLYHAVADADLVILQRKLLPSWQLSLVRRLAKSLIYDFDDAVFQRDSFQAKGPQSLRRQRRFLATIRAADTVIAGNAYLGRHASRIRGAGRIRIVPTTVQTDSYRQASHVRTGAGVRLVWIGSSSTLQGLELAARHLQAAGERTAGLELHLVCDRMADFPGVAVVPRRWSAATEVEDVAAADIGVSYLPDDAWSRGKCGLKVLQYMAAGLPVVANPVGMNRRMVVDGQTGLLADSPGEWAGAIARLAADPALRRRMGAAGRRAVEQRYSVERWGPQWADILESAVRRPLFEKVRGRAARAA